MSFFDFALPRKRSLTAAVRTTAAFFKGFVRPMNAHPAPDWPEALSGEVFRSLRACDRVAYLRWAGAVLRQLEALHECTPEEVVERRDLVSRLSNATELDITLRVNLGYVLPTWHLYLDAYEALEDLLCYAGEAINEPFPMSLETAKAIEGWSTSWDVIDFLYDMVKAEAEAVGIDLDALIGSDSSREMLLKRVHGFNWIDTPTD